jgi:hypothetical protein
MPFSCSVTPSWMSLMSLKRSPFRARFIFGNRRRVCRCQIWRVRWEATGSHGSIWKQETVSQCDPNLGQILFFCKSVPKICLASSLPPPRRSASSLVVSRLSCITMARAFSTFPLDRAETGRPGRGSSSSDYLRSWKRANRRKTCARLNHHRAHFTGLGTIPWQFSPV